MDAVPFLEWEIERVDEPTIAVEVTLESTDHLYFEIIEVREDDLATLATF